MLMDCTCGTNIEAKLDEGKDVVICMDCNEIVPVSSFTKTMMKQRRDVITRAELTVPPNGLKATCDNEKCNRDFSAEVDKEKDKVYCPHCKQESKISSVAINMLKDHHVYVGYNKRYFEEEGKDSDQFLDDVEADIASDPKNKSDGPQEPAKTKKAKKTAGLGRPKGAKNKIKAVKVGPNADGSLPTKDELLAVRDQLGKKSDN